MKNAVSSLLLTSLISILILQGCQPSPLAPQPTETLARHPSQTPGITVTQTPSPPPTNTPSPTTTPTTTPTATPTKTSTPEPTPTSIFQSNPVRVDLSRREHIDRPQLSGFVRYIDTEHFRIFYTLSGEDAVPIVDANGNAIPDYVEEVAIALEHSWQVEIEQLGWAAPPPDNGLGGDDRFDVYLEDLDLYIAGYVNDDNTSDEPRDNPRTTGIEISSANSYMGLDNDFAEIEELEDVKLSSLDFMRTTVAHELNHALQFGYSSDEPHRWLWEATATWVESYVYEDIKDSNFHLKAAFKAPDTCLLDYGGRDRIESAGHWYALWLFLRYISETYGEATIRELWDQLILLDGYDAFEAVLEPKGTTFEDVFRGYTVALLLRDFDFELDYPTVRLEGVVSGIQSWAPGDGVGQIAADFVEIDAQGVVEVSLWNLEDGILVGIRNTQADVYQLQDSKTVINADNYEHIYLIVLNLKRAQKEQDCRMTLYRVRVLRGGEESIPNETIQVQNFDPPEVEPLQKP